MKISRSGILTVLAAAFLLAGLSGPAHGQAPRETSPAAEEPEQTRSPRSPLEEARPGEGKPPLARPEAGESGPPREGRPSREDRRRFGSVDGPDDMLMLDRLLAMSPEQLARVRRALERIEAMEPEEREALRERLSEFRQIPPEQREKMREAWREMSPEERRQHIRELRERRWDKVLEPPEPSENS